jgi:hypothetical protein
VGPGRSSNQDNFGTISTFANPFFLEGLMTA